MGPIYLMIFGFIILLYCRFISFQDIQANDASPHVDIWYCIAPFGGIYTGMIYIQTVLSYIYLSFTSGLWYIFFHFKASNLQSSMSWKSGIFQFMSIQFSKTTNTILEIVNTYLTVWDFNFVLSKQCITIKENRET